MFSGRLSRFFLQECLSMFCAEVFSVYLSFFSSLALPSIATQLRDLEPRWWSDGCGAVHIVYADVRQHERGPILNIMKKIKNNKIDPNRTERSILSLPHYPNGHGPQRISSLGTSHDGVSLQLVVVVFPFQLSILVYLTFLSRFSAGENRPSKISKCNKR